MTQETAEKTKKKNLTDIGVGVILAICLYFLGLTLWNQYHNWQAQAPATNWVEVNSFAVPNFDPGVDPTIDYVRDIKQSVASSWTTEMRRYIVNTDDYEVICSNSGFSELEPGRTAPAVGWQLSSFAGKDCVDELEEGRYRLFVTWTLSPKGFDRTIRYPFSSNTFYVGAVS